MDILEPKTPDDVYKTWLEGLVLRPSYNLDVPVDSARHNLASTFVNAFVNAGFSRDKLVSVEDGNKWMYKNKQHGKFLLNNVNHKIFNLGFFFKLY